MTNKQTERFGIKIFASSIQRDHLHFAIQIPNRKSYVQFIRGLTGLISKKLGKGLWLFRPYTHVATWGRELRNLMNYLFRNDMEVFGIWDYSRGSDG